MAKRIIISTESHSDTKCAELRLPEREEAEINLIRNRLEIGLAQARLCDLADGDGADAIRKAFATARARRNDHHNHP